MRTSDRIILTILALLAIACVRLGFWQLDRRQERLAQNVWVTSQLSREPTTTLSGINELEEWVYRKTKIAGRFLNQHSLLLRNRSHDNQPGLHVVTPLALQDGNGTILVDRGWISNEEYIASGIEPYNLDDPVELIGIVRLSQPQPSISIIADPTITPNLAAIIEWKFLTIGRIHSVVKGHQLAIQRIRWIDNDLAREVAKSFSYIFDENAGHRQNDDVRSFAGGTLRCYRRAVTRLACKLLRFIPIGVP